MKHSVRAAYGGMLVGVSVVLLLFASIFPAMSWGLCTCAGMVPAIPLSRRQVRMSLLIYAATTVLAVLLVPGKRYVAAYMLLFGLYPLIKYGIERLRSLPAEWGCKLVYAGALCLFLWWLVRKGLLVPGGQAAALPPVILVAAFLVAFVCYDIIFSKVIALFRVFFRE